MRPPRMRAALLAAVFGAAPGILAGQINGAIGGVVRDSVSLQPLEGARIVVDAGYPTATTNGQGLYRLREVPAGWHRVVVSFIGYRAIVRDSVFVRSGQTTALDFHLAPTPVELEPLLVSAPVDSVLDPLAIEDVQRFTQEDLRRLPVSSVDEAIALSAGAVGESYRGGRLGQQAFILDGLGLKNQLDASTGSLGVRVPPDLLTEASLITNGFSARYGQAVSAMVNVVTRDGGERWHGRAAYETDRPLGDGWDYGLDRAVLQADGPLLGGLRFLAVADVSGRLDADPVNAPDPPDAMDPRSARPWLLPHNAGEQMDVAGKLTIPFGRLRTLRVLALRSLEQRLLFDPVYKYDPDFAPARRVSGTLLSGHLQQSFERQKVVTDLRVGYFTREFLRGAATEPVDHAVGAISGRTIHFVGEDLARAQDTAGAAAPIPGFLPPDFSERTPWGVPAFFAGAGSSGEVAWNRFRELRSRLDVSVGAGARTDLYFGGELTRQQVRTFHRVLGYLPAAGTVPPATASSFTPAAYALYSEVQARSNDLALTVGLRYDRFDARTDIPGTKAGAHQNLSPRLAISTVLKGATFVASYGQFSQAPDYQYLTDAAFDDTTRTGRFRRGNPDLGFEQSTQYEFSLRLRPSTPTSVRLNVYVRRLEGLVASVPLGVSPDSSIFGNGDAGSVKGSEIIFERELRKGWGVRVSYTLQQAEATSTSAFILRKAISIDPVTHDTVFPAKVEFPLDYDRRHMVTAIATAEVPLKAGPAVLGVRPLSGLQATAILRYVSGLPYSRTDLSGDSLIGVPNSFRLPSTSTIDMLVRRPLRVGNLGGSVYLDVRNLLNRRNIVAVRRDTGEPAPPQGVVQEMAESAYAAHPESIPYESPRYRASADLDHNGLIEGRPELFPLFLGAARDVSQPLFAFGQPRLVRLGVEFTF